MRGFRRSSLLVLLSLLLPCGVHAQQTTDAPPVLGTQTVTLGNATMPLTGPWKFHIGDSPQANGAGAPLWAQPNYDDSAWGTMDLTPPPGSYDPILGIGGFVSGWTARGYKGYSGYAWYRLRVNIQNNQGALALKMPANFDDAYQVYVNGQLMGQFGRFTAHGVTRVYVEQPRAFPLPAEFRIGPATMAIRMWMEPSTPLFIADAGGLHGPPVLGQVSSIAGLLRLNWDSIDRSLVSLFVEMAILLLAMLMAFSLCWLDRREQAYLWLGLVCAVTLANSGILGAQYYWPTWFTGTGSLAVQDAILTPLISGFWVVFWAYWFRLGGTARISRIVWSLVVLLAIGMAMLRAPFYGAVIPIAAIIWLSPVTLILKLLLGVVLVWVTVQGIRKNKVEGWLALPPVVLVIVAQYQQEFQALHVPVNYFAFGFAVSLMQIATVLSLFIIVVLLLRRFLHGQREREQWKLEFEQARQVQSLLVPNIAPATPGFAVESVYQPAQQVGGDFFHLRPGDDGSLLIVVGDVSGKGLKAAMTVSTIVGALRNEKSREPAEILEHINGVLCGQIKGFATCCIARIAADGRAVIANAGHLAPYRNGEEIALDNGLPLGIVGDSAYTVTQLQLAPGDRLTMLTDGVLEAMNAKRELFGFARVDAAMREEKSAVEIVAEAQVFGQEDDITVVRVTRRAIAVEQIAAEPAFAAE